MAKRNYAEITPEIEHFAQICSGNVIDRDLYERFKVNRGLRDMNGNGVLTGLTEISEVNGRTPEGLPMDGQLFYRGYNIYDLIRGFLTDGRFGFEEIIYLLLFGALPTPQELHDFQALLGSYRSLPNSFVRDIIMKAPSSNMMNSMARSVLTYYSYDPKAEDLSIDNVLRQCIQLIAMFPQLAVYSYQAYAYYLSDSTSFFFHDADPSLSTAENILYMLRQDGKYTEVEARALDTALVVHAEHGGGNNSSFTTHVVTSAGTDTYATIAAALGSLKGPKHGGANIMVCHMFKEIKENVKDWKDQDEIAAYLQKILHKEAFDHSGLIYGIGHAIYSRSDPRAKIFKSYVKNLASEKGCEEEYNLYEAVECLAPQIISSERKMYKGVCANVDFYSGFAYQLLGIPEELFTPLFAIARISGWSAHRIEELINGNRIIRPAYKAVKTRENYVPLSER
ncbi:MAG: citrate/2-methylcitrate synthase [Clostridia bacterium]|nr:citrate/2-methylcitrate synthase [Clostridia bacterium]MBR2288698.1 citrate/2-methylcitrate synthase [Clostridia bacterium]